MSPSKREDIEEDPMEDPPTSINPYTVLEIESDSTADQIKTAYRKQALRHHPDKALPEAKDTAHTKFQEVAFAYAILSDPRRRSRYDATGNTAESLDLDDNDFSWTDFFRSQKDEMVNAQAIQRIKDEYQGSEEERRDLISAFEEKKGDMDMVYEKIMCSNVLDDDERFRKIIDAAIKQKDVTAWKKYTSETAQMRRKRKKHAEDEAEEAELYAQELGVADKIYSKKSKKSKKADTEDHTDLAALIQQRQKGRQAGFLDSLEAKYGGKGAKKGSKVPDIDEPPESAFENNRKKNRAKR